MLRFAMITYNNLEFLRLTKGTLNMLQAMAELIHFEQKD